MIAARVAASAGDSAVNVLYAGSLVNLMERSAGPAFEQKSGDRFQGYAGGSNKIANGIKGKLRRGEKFISAHEKGGEPFVGQTNGNSVQVDMTFAECPGVIG